VALRSISLRDFVIVREITLELQQGFTVLTGETGAGKSILIDAIQLALGARAESSVIREGASRTDISVEFDTSDRCRTWLQEGGFDVSDGLLMRRTIDTQGKSRAWINGSVATAAQMRELGELLLDIHGQHAWQSLTRPEAVRQLLDAYAGVTTETLTDLWQEWRKAQKAVAESRTAKDSMQHQQERLTWQISELETLAPGDGEWDQLNALHTRLSNAQALIDAAQSALESLENEEAGAIGGLAGAAQGLSALSSVEPEFQGLAEVLRSSLLQAEDAVYSLHAYLRRTNPQPESLARLDERLAQWISLARRYRRPPADLHELLAGWKREAALLANAADADALEAAEQLAAKAYRGEATRISAQRRSAAPRLARAVTAAMQHLGMPGGRFEVILIETPQPTQGGLEEATFLVAGHAGITPRPVGRVASGGELSRIALAIAVTTSQLGAAQTLIFDEVDAGIGGAVAQAVGRLMKQLGRDRQVLAVTHLPQVAACADHHLVVAKQSEDGVTVSSVAPVEDTLRVSEIARMLGGGHLSATSVAHAREMLENGQRGAFVSEGTAT
jgi:DNA repair protein RecN (Recombination protein N)